MKAHVVLLLIAFGAARTAVAQASLRLTLDEAIRRGLEASHRLAEASARGDAARAVVDARRAGALPQISAQAGYARTNHVDVFGIPLSNNQLRVVYPDIPDNYRTRLDLQWPLYTAGRVEALERAARADASASDDDLSALRGEVRLDVARAYWMLVTAIESQRVVEESLTRVDAHLRDVRTRLDVGLVPPNDVLSVEAQASRQRMLRIQARTARDVAEADLARLIDMTGISIEPVLEPDVPSLPDMPLGVLVTEARRQRPERAALLKRVEALEARQAAAAAGRRPTIAVTGGLDYARPNPRIFPRAEVWKPAWDAAVNAVWALSDGGRSRAEEAEVAATARAMRERLAEFDSVLAAEIRQRAGELESSRAAVDAAGDATRSAAEARRVVGERFAAGVATSLDVLDAQVALLQAELDRVQAVAQTHLAQARLERALGR